MRMCFEVRVGERAEGEIGVDFAREMGMKRNQAA